VIELFLIDASLLFLAAVAAAATVAMRDLVSAVMMLAIYSLLLALAWVNMDAVDVAFTEAAVGAGISTLLFLGTIVIVGTREKPTRAVHVPALVTVVVTGAALGYGTLDMPQFGDPEGPAHTHPIARAYVTQTAPKARGEQPGAKAGEGTSKYDLPFHGHVDNFVTSVIVTYRAYDTLFEVAVIFTAGAGMILLLRGSRGPTEGSEIP